MHAKHHARGKPVQLPIPLVTGVLCLLILGAIPTTVMGDAGSAGTGGEDRFPPGDGYPSFFMQSQLEMTSGWTVDVNIFFPGFLRPSEKEARDSAAPFPVVVFSPPMDTDSLPYQDYMTTLVSYGFVVVGVSWMYEGNRDEDVAWRDHSSVLDLIEELGDDDTSPFYGMPDTTSCGAFGYSRGARAAFMSSSADPRIDAVAAWMPTLNNASDVADGCAKLLIGGTNDGTASPETYLDPLYETCHEPIVYILRFGDDHFSIESGFHGDLTNTFFRYHLLGEASLEDGLYGEGIRSRAEEGEFWLRMKWRGEVYNSINSAPVADAGEDMQVEPPRSVTLDGTGSTDDGEIVDYSWKISSDGGTWLRGGVTVSFNVEEPGRYIVTLLVTDDGGLQDEDDMVIDAIDLKPPQADAGSDRTVDQHVQVILDGSGSTDNHLIASWSWEFQYGGASMVLRGETVPFTFDDAGEYPVRLTVVDAYGNQDTDEMTVTVLDVTSPTARIDGDLVVDLGNAVELSGSASTDNVGIVKWTWTVFAEEGPFTDEGKVLTYIPDGPGARTVRLTVVDAAGNSGTSEVSVMVLDTIGPVARISGNLSATVGGTVTLHGTGSSDNVGIVSWEWSVSEGEKGTQYSGPSIQHVFETAGKHQVTLVVKDGAGNEASTTVVVDVSTDEPRESGVDGVFLIMSLAAISGAGLVMGIPHMSRWHRKQRRG